MVPAALLVGIVPRLPAVMMRHDWPRIVTATPPRPDRPRYILNVLSRNARRPRPEQGIELADRADDLACECHVGALNETWWHETVRPNVDGLIDIRDADRGVSGVVKHNAPADESTITFIEYLDQRPQVIGTRVAVIVGEG